MATRAHDIHTNSLVSDEQHPREVRSVARRQCYLCGMEGKVYYHGISDSYWNVGGTWDLRQCPNSECGLIWLDPVPLPEDIPLMYSEYFTHDGLLQGAAEKLRSRLLPFVCAGEKPPRKSTSGLLFAALVHFSPFRDFAAGSLMWLNNTPPGDMLDFGFGAGQLVLRLRDLGWNVAGVEFDHKVLTMAREKLNVDVRSSIMSFPESRFDVITLSHVIEHVPDPVQTLQQCAGRLKPGGRIVIATPNTNSLGHKYFGKDWRPLDPPRHLILFSPESLARCAHRAGLNVEAVHSSARSACFSWYSSQMLRKKKNNAGASISLAKNNGQPGLFLKGAGALFQLWEHYFGGDLNGEEVVLTARRPMAGAN